MLTQFKDTPAFSATTADNLNVMENDIKHYDVENVFGKSQEQLQNELDICRHIADTLTKREMLMLYHIRSSGIAMRTRFANTARQVYEAHKALSDLTDPT